MNFKYVVAIVPSEAVESLERQLRSMGVGGITLTRVKGFGEYKNFFTSDWLSEHTKIEIFTEESKVEVLLKALMETARSDVPGAGIAVVMPVESYSIFVPEQKFYLTHRSNDTSARPLISKESNMKCDSKMLVKMAVWLGLGLAVAYFAIPAAHAFIWPRPFLGGTHLPGGDALHDEGHEWQPEE